MIYVILGMHKSGTTLIAQILQHSGINMVNHNDVARSYDQGNKYERQSVKLLNKEILGCENVDSIDLTAPDPIQVTEAQRLRMRDIIQSCNRKYPAGWGFKDPRICLVYPFWALELPEHKLIAIYRSPYELWQRYQHWYPRNRLRDPYLVWKLLNRWCEYNRNILRYLQSTNLEFLVLEYQSLMTTQAELDRLQKFVGVELNDLRRKDLYRHRAEKKSLLLKVMMWLIQTQSSSHPEQIIQQLEALRGSADQKIYHEIFSEQKVVIK